MQETTGAVPDYPGDDGVTDDFGLAGVPDAFQRLWTPHRMAYIKGGQHQFKNQDDCPFCVAPGREDDDSLIVYRGRSCYVVLNLFPYNPGHLLVCPYRHVPDYTDLTVGETAEFAELTQTAMRVLRKVANPGGFNLGMNQGVTGGAGVAGHLHQHVVPRWGGDGNFFPIIAQTKAITQTLGEVRQQVADAWPQGNSQGSDAGDTLRNSADNTAADNTAAANTAAANTPGDNTAGDNTGQMSTGTTHAE